MKKIIFFLIAMFMVSAVFAINPKKPTSKNPVKTVAKVHKKKAKKPLSYYWYSVQSNITTPNTVTNSDCTFVQFGPIPPEGLCSGQETYYCIIGLSSSQVNTTTHVISGNQLPMTIYHWKGLND